MKFTIESEYKPTGDQPGAIKQLVSNIEENEQYSTSVSYTHLTLPTNREV